ncbi:2Fe-2S iron-sulfur cluster-binding protein [Ideonella sp. A 288]|uniref:2Fe-2S iron-sulfur cluster-binding protein n=1 Tax=Ideonella sp. A 288 TaxID=1962181 RepID=UPI000B4A88AE|nr:2Fe-2S iron-sulfur cluster-binding protein [Ideonella sp. A 288]
MITLHFQHDDGHEQTLRAKPGRSLMRAATSAGIAQIAADCGGCLTCATCHVIVDPAWAARLPAPGSDEQAMLDMTAVLREPTSRLSCQILLDASLDGLRVRLPSRQY